jgi:integrase
MPRRRLPPRLYLDPTREEWVVRDGARFIRTGCSKRDSGRDEKFLAQYISEKHKPEPSGAPLISDVLRVYAEEALPEKRSAKKIIYNVSNLLKWWGDKTVAQITMRSCKEYAGVKPIMAASKADLIVLKSATDYWHKSDYGPLNFTLAFWKPKANPPKERWLTKHEASRLLKAAKPYPHLRRLILLGLYTGSRPGVILSLKWSQVDLRSGVLSRTPEGVIQSKTKRAPKVRLGRRILAHLRRWKRLDDGYNEYVCHYQGRPVEDPHAAWSGAIKAANLPAVTRHTLRHTRATWMAHTGVPLFDAAGFLGMTTKTLESVYAHHHPDWQEHAANI